METGPMSGEEKQRNQEASILQYQLCAQSEGSGYRPFGALH